MFNASKFSNKNTSSRTQSDSWNKLLHIGETMIEDKKFDIKQYLETAENQFIKKNPFKNSYNLSTDHINFKTKLFSSNSNNKYHNNSFKMNYKLRNKSIINNNLSLKTLEYKIPSINIKSISTKGTRNVMPKKINNYSTSTNFSKSTNIKTQMNSRYKNMYDDYNITQTNSEKYFRIKKNDDQDKKLFKMEKYVKEIRKKKNKYFDFNKYIEKMTNYYDKKNALIALDSDNVLHNYKVKHKRLKDKDTPINTFITDNKEISVNNLLIKILNTESNKLMKKERTLNKDLKNEIFSLENGEKRFVEYSDMQKIECSKLVMTLAKLQKRNKDLMGEENKIKLELKIKEYEIYKILAQMNIFRFYAKFANQILDGDPARFEDPILPNDIEFDKIDLEKIIKDVLDKYSSMKKYEPKKDKNKSLKFYKEEGYFLYDPELIYHKYNEIEGNILRLLRSKENLIAKIKKRQKQNNDALSYLIDRINILQQEYNEVKIQYKEMNEKNTNSIKINYNTHIDININEINNYIKELYICVINEFEPMIRKLSKINDREFNIIDKSDLVQFDEIVKYGQYILENIETNLNYLLLKIKEQEKSDKQIFDKVIYGIKTHYKLIRQSLFFENRIKKTENQIKKASEKARKIVLISRKSEPPYYNNKTNKKEEIDIESIKKEENKELMIYH